QVRVELPQVQPASIGVVVSQQKAPLREQVSQLGVLQLADQFVNVVRDQLALVDGSPDREKFEFLPLGPRPDWTTAENSILVLFILRHRPQQPGRAQSVLVVKANELAV